MSLRSKLIINVMIAHVVLMTMANSPDVQTAVYKGVPDNWASDVDVAPFTKIGQKYYYFNLEKKLNWFDSVNECRKLNAQLASLETSDEYDALINHFKSLGFDDYKYFWTSGNDLGNHGEFFWLGTGNPFGYTRWGPNEPNNANNNEHCVHLSKQQGIYRLNDVPCNDLRTHYLCEAKRPKTIAITVW